MDTPESRFISSYVNCPLSSRLGSALSPGSSSSGFADAPGLPDEYSRRAASTRDSCPRKTRL
jgi:hypothetical protein